MTDWDYLDELDVPRGVVEAANKFAASKVDLLRTVKLAEQYDAPEIREMIFRNAKAQYSAYFDSFIAGAKWNKCQASESNRIP